MIKRKITQIETKELEVVKRFLNQLIDHSKSINLTLDKNTPVIISGVLKHNSKIERVQFIPSNGFINLSYENSDEVTTIIAENFPTFIAYSMTLLTKVREVNPDSLDIGSLDLILNFIEIATLKTPAYSTVNLCNGDF